MRLVQKFHIVTTKSAGWRHFLSWIIFIRNQKLRYHTLIMCSSTACVTYNKVCNISWEEPGFCSVLYIGRGEGETLHNV